jgi:hypothetical protein
MPNQEKWSVTRTEGNPTQSKDVIDLLKAIKMKEVQKQGAKSMTQCQMFGKEFQNMQKSCVRLMAMANGLQPIRPRGKVMV